MTRRTVSAVPRKVRRRTCYSFSFIELTSHGAVAGSEDNDIGFLEIAICELDTVLVDLLDLLALLDLDLAVGNKLRASNIKIVT